MINNGGGIFNANNEVDCVTPANLEAMQWVTDLVKQGLVSSNAVSYTDSDAVTQWQKKNYVMGIGDAGYNIDTGDQDITVMSEPLAAPNGEKSNLVDVNPQMMYKQKSPSQAGSEAFLEWYVTHTGPYWEKGLLDGLPVLKSTTKLPSFKAQTNLHTSSEKWMPVAKSFAATGTTLDREARRHRRRPPI